MFNPVVYSDLIKLLFFIVWLAECMYMAPGFGFMSIKAVKLKKPIAHRTLLSLFDICSAV